MVVYYYDSSVNFTTQISYESQHILSFGRVACRVQKGWAIVTNRSDYCNIMLFLRIFSKMNWLIKSLPNLTRPDPLA